MSTQLAKDSSAGRVEQLYNMHAAKQETLRQKREQEKLEEVKKIQEEVKENQLGTRRANRTLNPQAAVERLFKDGQHAGNRLLTLKAQQEAELLESIEKSRFRPQARRPLSARSPREKQEEHTQRLHQESARRADNLEQKRRAHIKSEQDKLGDVHKKALLAPSGRCEKLHEEAAARQEKLAKKRAEAEKEALGEMKPSSRVVNNERIEALYLDHAERKLQQQKRQKDFAQEEQSKLQKEKAHILSRTHVNNGPRMTSAVLFSFTLDGWDKINKDRRQDILESLKSCIASVADAPDTELDVQGADVGKNALSDKSVDIVEVVATIYPPEVERKMCDGEHGHSRTKEDCEILLRRICDDNDIFPYNGKLAKAMEEAVNLAAVAEEKPNIVHNLDGYHTEFVRVEEKRVPIWERKQQVRPKEPQRRDSHEVAEQLKNTRAEALSTSADVAMQAVVSTIQARCGYGKVTEKPICATKEELTGLSTSLAKALRFFKDATAKCEQEGHGYHALCARRHKRLVHGGKLLTDQEGWKTNTESDPIRQVQDNLDELLDTAAIAQQALLNIIHPPSGDEDQSWIPGARKASPELIPFANFAYNPGIKTRDACELKAFVRFQAGDGQRRHRQLLDIARVGLVFKSCEDLMIAWDLIEQELEVVDIKNYFCSPTRLGKRHVDIRIVQQVLANHQGQLMEVPHVCEIRLEVACMYDAHNDVAQPLQDFYNSLRALYGCPEDIAAVVYLAKSVLLSPPECHAMRLFRRQMARRFGSTVCAWRRTVGTNRLFSFERLRDVCQVLKLREHAPEYWEKMDQGRGGLISLFELDPEAVGTLMKARRRIMVCMPGAEELDKVVFFSRLCYKVKAKNPGVLEEHEFRQVMKPLGFSTTEADAIFNYLDYMGGNYLNPPAKVGIADLDWLRKLPTLVDAQAVSLVSPGSLSNPSPQTLRRRLPVQQHRQHKEVAPRAPEEAAPNKNSGATGRRISLVERSHQLDQFSGKKASVLNGARKSIQTERRHVRAALTMGWMDKMGKMGQYGEDDDTSKGQTSAASDDDDNMSDGDFSEDDYCGSCGQEAAPADSQAGAAPEASTEVVSKESDLGSKEDSNSDNYFVEALVEEAEDETF